MTACPPILPIPPPQTRFPFQLRNKAMVDTTLHRPCHAGYYRGNASWGPQQRTWLPGYRYPPECCYSACILCDMDVTVQYHHGTVLTLYPPPNAPALPTYVRRLALHAAAGVNTYSLIPTELCL